jgi:hypothetical protein
MPWIGKSVTIVRANSLNTSDSPSLATTAFKQVHHASLLREALRLTANHDNQARLSSRADLADPAWS